MVTNAIFDMDMAIDFGFAIVDWLPESMLA